MDNSKPAPQAAEALQSSSTEQSQKAKKSWEELRQTVRNIHRKLAGFSTKTPSSFCFRHVPDESGLDFLRIYFLSTLASGRETTLLYVDVFQSSPEHQQLVFQWQPLLESTFQVMPPLGRFSREELLQWERKRVVMLGITSYDYHCDSGRFVFPACGSIFYCDDNNEKNPPFYPTELKSSLSCARLNPQMCPWNPELVAFVARNDLWVYHILSGQEVRLTCSRGAVSASSLSSMDEPVSAAMPSYVTQEEFNRYTGYWWQPCCPEEDGVYRILYEEVDERDVALLQLPSYGGGNTLEVYRFPRAGTSNARSVLKMVQFTLTCTGEFEAVQLMMLDSLQSLCPQMEYLVRAGWTTEAKHVWAQVLDRQQKHLQLVLIPLSNFVPLDHMDDLTSNHICDTPVLQVICEEFSDVWINVHDVLHFFAQDSEDELTFLWASEESGFRHLYLITVGLLFQSTLDKHPLDCLDKPECSAIQRIKKKIPLTSGAWEVSEKDVWVDEARGYVYFIGLKDTPLERHLYVVPLNNPCEIKRLTTLGYSYTIYMNEDCSAFVSIQSSISQPPFGQVFYINHLGPKLEHISIEPQGYILEKTATEPDHIQPELIECSLHPEHIVYGMIFKPPNMEPSKKYPTVLIIYGGPEVQLVSNTFKGMSHLRQHLLAHEGYVVVAVDCRGSRHRGVAFESHIKGKMGTVEIADQVEVLKWIAERKGFIDMSRVAIHGWSYGGYLSLMGLVQRPDIFKVAVAGAPVTNWKLYDTGYTERYMDTPQNNPDGYRNGCVLSYVNQFPSEENRLLIIHGLMDENVHFFHTSQLVSALVKAGKPYQLQVYPSERHSLRHLEASEHYETCLLSFLQHYL